MPYWLCSNSWNPTTSMPLLRSWLIVMSMRGPASGQPGLLPPGPVWESPRTL